MSSQNRTEDQSLEGRWCHPHNPQPTHTSIYTTPDFVPLSRLLLQTRTKVLNDELEDVFRRWYPQFRPPSEQSSLTPDFVPLSE